MNTVRFMASMRKTILKLHGHVSTFFCPSWLNCTVDNVQHSTLFYKITEFNSNVRNIIFIQISNMSNFISFRGRQQEERETGGRERRSGSISPERYNNDYYPIRLFENIYRLNNSILNMGPRGEILQHHKNEI